MKFRTQLTLFPLCVFLVACIIVSYIFSTWSDMRSLFQRSEQVTEIFEFVDELQHLLKEYEKTNEVEYLKQLERQQDSLQFFLSKLIAFPPAQKTLINSIEMNLRGMDRKVHYVIANNDTKEGSQRKAIELMLGKLFINMEVIRENSYQLNTYVSEELKGKSKIQLFIVTLALIATSIIFLLLSTRVSHKLQSYLKAMSRGLKQVSKGELEHPIHVDDNDDELSAFINEFNRLSYELKETMISRDELQQIIDQKTRSLKKLANTDPLTQVNNRRKLFVDGNNEIERAKRYGHSLSLLIIDADNFKKINDSYGHHTGDRVLINLCRIFEEEVRGVDVIGRYGGEEFVILLPETNHSSAREIAERIRYRVSDQLFLSGEQHINISISIGVTTLTEETDLITLIDKADKALNKAKHFGKNAIQSSD